MGWTCDLSAQEKAAAAVSGASFSFVGRELDAVRPATARTPRLRPGSMASSASSGESIVAAISRARLPVERQQQTTSNGEDGQFSLDCKRLMRPEQRFVRFRADLWLFWRVSFRHHLHIIL